MWVRRISSPHAYMGSILPTKPATRTPFFCFAFDTGSHVAKAGLEFAIQLRLALNPSPVLLFLSVEVTGMCPQV